MKRSSSSSNKATRLDGIARVAIFFATMLILGLSAAVTSTATMSLSAAALTALPYTDAHVSEADEC